MEVEPYFSQNFAPNPPAVQMYKQQLFIDARDFQSEITENNKMEFTVKFSSHYENNSLNLGAYSEITQVELLGLCFPKIANENYVIVDIPEFHGVMHSSDNTGSHDKFAIVYFDNAQMTTTKPMKGKDFAPKICKFNPPLKRLNKFTIRFLQYRGATIDPNDLNLKNVSLLLEFTIKA
jgi:hypothetical protein